ncbi:hypothetical protein [Dokdonella sp.]|nr:hypothetical protein [Dokdonella sp.]MBX3691326.1 hypothetical protein [Dokdonella sp.]
MRPSHHPWLHAAMLGMRNRWRALAWVASGVLDLVEHDAIACCGCTTDVS